MTFFKASFKTFALILISLLSLVRSYRTQNYRKSISDNFSGLPGIANASNYPIFENTFTTEVELASDRLKNSASLKLNRLDCRKPKADELQLIGSASAQMLTPECISRFQPDDVKTLLTSRNIGISGKSHIFQHASLTSVENFKSVIQGIYKNGIYNLDWGSSLGKFVILNATDTHLGDGHSLLTIVNKWNKATLIEYALHALGKGMNYHFCHLFDRILPTLFEKMFSTAILPEIECTKRQNQPICGLIVNSAVNMYSENLRRWPGTIHSDVDKLIPVLPTRVLRNYGRKKFIKLMQSAEQYDVGVTQSLAIIDEAFGDWMELEFPTNDQFIPYLGTFTPFLSYTQVLKWYRQQPTNSRSTREFLTQFETLVKFSPNWMTLKAFESILIGRTSLTDSDNLEKMRVILPLLSLEDMEIFSLMKLKEFQNIEVS